MFQRLKEAVTQRMDEAVARTRADLEATTCGEALKNFYQKKLMTPMAFQMIQASAPTDKIPADAVRKMVNRVSKKERAWLMDSYNKLSDADEAEFPEYIYISVEWRRSRTWGNNPTATVRASGHVTYGSATGCGYDKESSAVASAMNKNPSVLKVWYTNAEEGRPFEYSVNGGIKDKRLPSMDGGCGMSATKDVFAALGYTCEETHGKMYDSYVFHKEVGNGKRDH